MSIIRILPTEVSNRIAAGEVVERPASIVKELVENSIDAGATRIVINTQKGGKNIIQITDNGRGMDADDSLLCLEAHATSKIRQVEDILQISTMGFRGEAIPSIASVSKFHLQSRPQDQQHGTEVIVEHGKMSVHQQCGCAQGTNIRISQLFGNLPGRKKFLKSDQTEDGHIQECIINQALAHPEITFELNMNGRQVFFTPNNIDLKNRIGLLLGKEIVSYLLPVDYSENGMTIKGFISSPEYTRPNRREQRFFINNRPAAAESVYHAIRNAYDTLIYKNNYPIAVLYLQIATDKVDVNVHPAKREVRFKDDKIVSLLITNAIQKALANLRLGIQSSNIPISNSDIPTLFPNQKKETNIPSWFTEIKKSPEPVAATAKEMTVKKEETTIIATPISNIDTVQNSRNKHQESIIIATMPPAPVVIHKEINNNNLKIIEPPKKESLPSVIEQKIVAPPKSNGSNSTSLPKLSFDLLGQLKSGDIVAAGNSGLVLIDPNAAQQRIIFEQLLRYSKNNNDLMVQPLLIPFTFDTNPEDAVLLDNNIEQFKKIGFSINHFGGRTYLIDTIPIGIPEQDLYALIHDILEDLRLSGSGKSKIAEMQLIKVAANKASPLKKSMSTTEAETLLKHLLQTEMPYTTPEGKPTMINIPFNELNRRFLRQK